MHFSWCLKNKKRTPLYIFFFAVKAPPSTRSLTRKIKIIIHIHFLQPNFLQTFLCPLFSPHFLFLFCSLLLILCFPLLIFAFSLYLMNGRAGTQSWPEQHDTKPVGRKTERERKGEKKTKMYVFVWWSLFTSAHIWKPVSPKIHRIMNTLYGLWFVYTQFLFFKACLWKRDLFNLLIKCDLMQIVEHTKVLQSLGLIKRETDVMQSGSFCPDWTSRISVDVIFCIGPRDGWMTAGSDWISFSSATINWNGRNYILVKV